MSVSNCVSHRKKVQIFFPKMSDHGGPSSSPSASSGSSIELDMQFSDPRVQESVDRATRRNILKENARVLTFPWSPSPTPSPHHLEVEGIQDSRQETCPRSLDSSLADSTATASVTGAPLSPKQKNEMEAVDSDGDFEMSDVSSPEELRIIGTRARVAGMPRFFQSEVLAQMRQSDLEKQKSKNGSRGRRGTRGSSARYRNHNQRGRKLARDFQENRENENNTLVSKKRKRLDSENECSGASSKKQYQETKPGPKNENPALVKTVAAEPPKTKFMEKDLYSVYSLPFSDSDISEAELSDGESKRTEANDTHLFSPNGFHVRTVKEINNDDLHLAQQDKVLRENPVNPNNCISKKRKASDLDNESTSESTVKRACLPLPESKTSPSSPQTLTVKPVNEESPSKITLVETGSYDFFDFSESDTSDEGKNQLKEIEIKDSLPNLQSLAEPVPVRGSANNVGTQTGEIETSQQWNSQDTLLPLDSQPIIIFRNHLSELSNLYVQSRIHLTEKYTEIKLLTEANERLEKEKAGLREKLEELRLKISVLYKNLAPMD